MMDNLTRHPTDCQCGRAPPHSPFASRDVPPTKRQPRTAAPHRPRPPRPRGRRNRTLPGLPKRQRRHSRPARRPNPRPLKPAQMKIPRPQPRRVGRSLPRTPHAKASSQRTPGCSTKYSKSGDGASPGPTDTVTTHYHGTFVDGRVFDSSVQKRRPRLVSRRSCHRGLDGSPSDDAGRRQVENRLSPRPGIRRAGPRRYSAQFDAHLRGRAARRRSRAADREFDPANRCRHIASPTIPAGDRDGWCRGETRFLAGRRAPWRSPARLCSVA